MQNVNNPVRENPSDDGIEYCYRMIQHPGAALVKHGFKEFVYPQKMRE